MKTEKSMKKVKKYSYISIAIIFVIVALSINALLKQMDSKLTPIEIRDNKINISSYTYSINDITKVELLDEVSISVGSGANTPNTNKGSYYVNGENIKSKVYIHKNISPYIRIHLKDSIVVFNSNNSNDTQSIYNNLLKLKK